MEALRSDASHSVFRELLSNLLYFIYSAQFKYNEDGTITNQQRMIQTDPILWYHSVSEGDLEKADACRHPVSSHL